MRAMILAAGLGTRLKPLTDTIPKALIKIKEFTLLELQFRKLQSEGFDKIIINIHHFSEKIKEYLEQSNFFDFSITLSDESEKLLDTGGGLKKASHFFSDGKPFLVYNVDVLSNINLERLLNHHLTSGNLATIAVRDRKSSRKFLFNQEKILCGWMNSKTGEKITVGDDSKGLIPYAFSGIQIISPAIFHYLPDKDVFSLIDLYLLVSKKEKIGCFIHNEDEWLDLGKIENLDLAEKLFDKIRNTYRA